jgi:hypothetical protein
MYKALNEAKLGDSDSEYKVALEKMKNHITHSHFKDCKPVEGGRDGMKGG